MMDRLGEGTRLDKMVGHENRVTLVPIEHGDGVSSDPGLHRRKHCTSAITKSTIMQGIA